MRPTRTNVKPTVLLPAGLILSLSVSLCVAVASEPPAASAAFTSKDPVVLKALGLMKSGKFQEAEKLLGAADSKADPEALRARQETTEIIRRTRIEYSLDEAGLLAKVRKSVPDATTKDVERWAKDSAARYRVIDGKKFYFRREPQNIFLFCGKPKRAGPRPATHRVNRSGSSPIISKLLSRRRRKRAQSRCCRCGTASPARRQFRPTRRE